MKLKCTALLQNRTIPELFATFFFSLSPLHLHMHINFLATVWMKGSAFIFSGKALALQSPPLRPVTQAYKETFIWLICLYSVLQMQDSLADISYSWNNSHPVTWVTCISLLDIKYRINMLSKDRKNRTSIIHLGITSWLLISL